MQLSSLLDRFSEPETLKMAKLGRELRAKGIDVIDLSLGEPDFDTPPHMKYLSVGSMLILNVYTKSTSLVVFPTLKALIFLQSTYLKQ